MRKEKRYETLIRYFHFWTGKLGLKEPTIIKRDNRMDSPLCVYKEEGNIFLLYHSRKIGQRKMCSLLSDVFHEIGHIFNDLPYETKKDIIESEYQAEKFSVKMMKKHYPTQYKKLLKRLKKYQLIKHYKKEDPIYYHAFIRIPDYKNTIKGGLK